MDDEWNEVFIRVTCVTNSTNREFELDSLKTTMMAEVSM